MQFTQIREKFINKFGPPIRVILKVPDRNIWEVYATRIFSGPWKKSIVLNDNIAQYITPRTIIADNLTWTREDRVVFQVGFIDINSRRHRKILLTHMMIHQNFCMEEQIWMVQSNSGYVDSYFVGTIMPPKLEPASTKPMQEIEI